MIQIEDKLLLENIFPQVRSVKSGTKEETIKLAHRVAAALKQERQKLVEEHQNNFTSRFLPTSS